ncbi:hypothetical protein WME73_17810 [Sorangium sp. So ce302]|uniref:hypothetical protein n=1 Tax=Sorangium sp. So ce302 TaxID=3133297 RepID=UPI003F5E3891
MLAIFAPRPGSVASFEEGDAAVGDACDAGDTASGAADPGEGASASGEGRPGAARAAPVASGAGA